MKIVCSGESLGVSALRSNLAWKTEMLVIRVCGPQSIYFIWSGDRKLRPALHLHKKMHVYVVKVVHVFLALISQALKRK